MKELGVIQIKTKDGKAAWLIKISTIHLSKIL